MAAAEAATVAATEAASATASATANTSAAVAGFCFLPRNFPCLDFRGFTRLDFDFGSLALFFLFAVFAVDVSTVLTGTVIVVAPRTLSRGLV